MNNEMSIKELKAHQGKKPNKFRNTVLRADGMKFDSRKEYKHYLFLKDEQERGKISNLKCQESFALQVNNQTVCTYISDFTFQVQDSSGQYQLQVEDVKSVITRKLPAYRIKKKLMKAIYGIDVVEI